MAPETRFPGNLHDVVSAYFRLVDDLHVPAENIIIAGDKKSAEIRNFLGEKRVRNIAMLEGVTIQEDKAQKDQVLVEGNDIDLVSQSAALLHGATLVRNKDIRKFLDGIYCTGKDTVVKAEA